MDLIKHYRFFLLWSPIFSILCAVSALIVYRKWKALGGPEAYLPP